MAWEPGDDICPPWPWWKRWPGPRPPWWNERLTRAGEEVFAGLTLVNLASHVSDAHVATTLAKTGVEMINKYGQELNKALSQGKG